MNPAAAVSITLPASPAAPSVARATVAEALGNTRASEDACLVVSELVTNALVHGDPVEIQVVVRIFEEFGRIEVTSLNRDSDLLRAGGPSDNPGAGGFGLAIVDQLSDQWGVQNRSTVWSEIILADSLR